MPIIGIFTWILCHTAMSIIIWEFHFGCLFYGKDDIPSGWWCSNHLEKYEFVNGKDYPIYEMENKKCLKPPYFPHLSIRVTSANGSDPNNLHYHFIVPYEYNCEKILYELD